MNKQIEKGVFMGLLDFTVLMLGVINLVSGNYLVGGVLILAATVNYYL